MSKQIPLTQGKVAIVDDEDFEFLSRYKWRAVYRDKWYAVTGQTAKNLIYMHRFILGLQDPGIFADHRDGDGLNNLRSNLRSATPAQNSQNKKRSVINKAGYKGVRRRSGRKKVTWIAQICVNYKQIYLGDFAAPEEAAKAYDRAAQKHFGEFARLNFPQ